MTLDTSNQLSQNLADNDLPHIWEQSMTSSNQAVQNLFGGPSTPKKSMSLNKNTSWKSQHENDGLSKYGGRDLVGFGQKPPCPKWPGGAKVVRRNIHWRLSTHLRRLRL